MTALAKKSPFRVLKYILFLFYREILCGDKKQRQRFVHRFTSRLFLKCGLYDLAYGVALFGLRIGSLFKSPEERALIRNYGRWIVAISGLENRDELTSWLTERDRPHIIVMGVGSVGDVLQVTPVLRAWQEKVPTAKIAFLHRSQIAKIVLNNNPNVDTIASADFHQFAALKKAVSKEGAADLIVEIESMSFILTYTCAPEALRHPDFNAALPEGFFKTAAIVRQRWAKPHGYQKPDGKFTWPKEWDPISYLDALGMMGNLTIHSQSELDFFPEPNDEDWIKTLPLLQNTSYVTVQTGVDTDVMNWSRVTGQRASKLLPITTWQQLTELLAKNKVATVQIGAKEDIAIEGITLDLRGKTTLSQAAVLMKKAHCHIGTEGGLVHLARAVNAKSIVLFGPTSVAFLGYPQNINLTASDCVGCWGATKEWFIYCPRGLSEPECMNAFRVEMIAEAVNKIDAKGQPKRAEL